MNLEICKKCSEYPDFFQNTGQYVKKSDEFFAVYRGIYNNLSQSNCYVLIKDIYKIDRMFRWGRIFYDRESVLLSCEIGKCKYCFEQEICSTSS